MTSSDPHSRPFAPAENYHKTPMQLASSPPILGINRSTSHHSIEPSHPSPISNSTLPYPTGPPTLPLNSLLSTKKPLRRPFMLNNPPAPYHHGPPLSLRARWQTSIPPLSLTYSNNGILLHRCTTLPRRIIIISDIAWSHRSVIP